MAVHSTSTPQTRALALAVATGPIWCFLCADNQRRSDQHDRLDKALNPNLLFVYLTQQNQEDNAHCLHWSSRPFRATVCRDFVQNFHDDLLTTGCPASSVCVLRVL
jgi:hypothetical protein